MEKNILTEILEEKGLLYSEGVLLTTLKNCIQNGQVLFVPFPRGTWSWHVYPMSKTNSKKGWTKRLVSWEQMVAGLAKDPNGIYVRGRFEADKKIEELKKNAETV